MHFSAIATILISAVSVVSSKYIPVDVGPNGKLVYSPNQVYADPGDVVLFKFNLKNHTATTTSLDYPCFPSGGFDTGFQPRNATNVDDFKPIPFHVYDKEPKWFYCRQTNPSNHCNAGMVFAINPPPGTFDDFLWRAIHADTSTTTWGEKPWETKTWDTKTWGQYTTTTPYNHDDYHTDAPTPTPRWRRQPGSW